MANRYSVAFDKSHSNPCSAFVGGAMIEGLESATFSTSKGYLQMSFVRAVDAGDGTKRRTHFVLKDSPRGQKLMARGRATPSREFPDFVEMDENTSLAPEGGEEVGAVAKSIAAYLDGSETKDDAEVSSIARSVAEFMGG